MFTTLLSLWPEYDSRIDSIDDKLKLGNSYVDTKCSDCLPRCVQTLFFYTPRYNSGDSFFCLIPRSQKENAFTDNFERILNFGLMGCDILKSLKGYKNFAENYLDSQDRGRSFFRNIAIYQSTRQHTSKHHKLIHGRINVRSQPRLNFTQIKINCAVVTHFSNY